MSKMYAAVSAQCVACGSCMKVCPKGALSIPHGIIAIVDTKKCVGCGKCMQECPAGVITLLAREERYANNEKTLV